MNMLAGTKLKMVQDLVASSTREELIWINGYLAGLVSGATEAETAPPTKLLTSKITIAYGTESGNSKRLASTFAATAKGKGIQVKLVNLEQYRLTDIIKEEYFFAVISTQGDGEPPAGAKKFYDHIHLNGFKLNKMKYGVLALGDTSYPLFCKAGEDVDVQLKNLGGERIVDLYKCDTDYETEAGSWFTQVLQKLTEGGATASPATVIPVTGKKTTGKQFYTGTILSNINLNDRGSKKQTHHIEIGVDEIDYQPGDSIGIVPDNPTAIVDAIIKVSGINPDALITYRNEKVSVYDLLRKKLNVSFLPERVIKRYAEVVKQEIPATNIGLLDLLKIYSVKDAAQFEEVLDILEPITPRLYSIASSLEAHSGEVHITVSRDRFCVDDEWKFGLCSDYLTLLPEGTQLQFYVHRNNRFRLPSAEKDIIMIGPGTGIAPFRSFLAERDATGAGGKNWLFFGEQHFESDFLYQTEIQNWHDTGVLTKVNVAFSRDQQEKIYVQHKMQQNGAEIFQWLESGATVYICGSKEPMSVDVEHTLVDIISRHGNKSTEESVAYLEELKESDRFLADVY